MTETILVPLDGSPLSEHALPLATALTRTLGGQLLLVYAESGRVNQGERPPDLEAIARSLRSSGLSVSSYSCTVGDPGATGRAILAAAALHSASLIVMATHGYGGLGRWLYGSVAGQILSQTTVPVMLVSPSLSTTWPDNRPPRVLVPLDGSERAEAILDPLLALVKPLNGQLLLLRVSEGVDYTHVHGDSCAVCRSARAAGAEPDIEPVRSRRYLERVAARLRADNVTVEYETKIGGAAATITEIAKEREVDLIAMATQGRTGLGGIVMGSVATDTVRRAGVPLLLVRSAESAG